MITEKDLAYVDLKGDPVKISFRASKAWAVLNRHNWQPVSEDHPFFGRDYAKCSRCGLEGSGTVISSSMQWSKCVGYQTS